MYQRKVYYFLVFLAIAVANLVIYSMDGVRAPSYTQHNLLSGAQIQGPPKLRTICFCPLAGLAADTGGTISFNACDGGHGSQPPGTAKACGKGSCTLILPQTNPELGSDTINVACNWAEEKMCDCAGISVKKGWKAYCEKKYDFTCESNSCMAEAPPDPSWPDLPPHKEYILDKNGDPVPCKG